MRVAGDIQRVLARFQFIAAETVVVCVAVIVARRGIRVQQAKSRLWELGLNIGKISFDEGINLLNQREARVYLQTPSAGSRARLGAKVDLKLTLDAAKVTAQSAAADKEMIKAAEELRRLDAETADSLARVRLDSLANRPVEAEPVIDDGLFPDEETAEDEFSNNAHVR